MGNVRLNFSIFRKGSPVTWRGQTKRLKQGLRQEEYTGILTVTLKIFGKWSISQPMVGLNDKNTYYSQVRNAIS